MTSFLNLLIEEISRTMLKCLTRTLKFKPLLVPFPPYKNNVIMFWARMGFLQALAFRVSRANQAWTKSKAFNLGVASHFENTKLFTKIKTIETVSLYSGLTSGVRHHWFAKTSSQNCNCLSSHHLILQVHSFSPLREKIMSWKSKAWVVACTIAAWEEIKNKKMSPCTSNILSLYHHHLNNKLGPVSSQVERSKQENLEQSEESLRKIMYLSCWGPNQSRKQNQRIV